MLVYLFVLVCGVVYLFSHNPGSQKAPGQCFVHGHNTRTQDVGTFFGSENINEDVSLLGKSVGVAVVYKGLGVSRKWFQLNEIGKYKIVIVNHCHVNNIHRVTICSISQLLFNTHSNACYTLNVETVVVCKNCLNASKKSAG